MIGPFNGKYSFLSNFWETSVKYDGITYPSAEHAFQAAKTLDKGERNKIRVARTPGMAKRLGRKVKLRPGWNSMRVNVMLEILRSKFSDNPFCREWLLRTGNEELVEVNTWNDKFWGVCGGEGENHLGRLLMQVRKELREKQ